MSMNEQLNGSMPDVEAQREGYGQNVQARSQLLEVDDVIEFKSPFASNGI